MARDLLRLWRKGGARVGGGGVDGPIRSVSLQYANELCKSEAPVCISRPHFFPSSFTLGIKVEREMRKLSYLL